MVAAALQKHVRRVARPAASSSRAAAATDFQRIQESEARTVAAVAVATIGSIPFEFFMVGQFLAFRDVQSCLFEGQSETFQRTIDKLSSNLGLRNLCAGARPTPPRAAPLDPSWWALPAAGRPTSSREALLKHESDNYDNTDE